MRIIIGGAGEVGRGVARALRSEGQDVVLIDTDPKAIKESEVNLTIKIEGSIVSHSDGELISSDSLLFEIPLLSILVLNDPINYEIVFEK